MTVWCIGCQAQVPREKFTSEATVKSRLCRECNNAKSRRYAEKNPDKVRKRNKDRYDARSPERVEYDKQRTREYRERVGMTDLKRVAYQTDEAYRERVKLQVRCRNHIGFTPETLRAWLDENDSCNACGDRFPNSRSQHIDHDHSCCGKNKSCHSCRRGVLCTNCNTALGHLKDSAERINSLKAYLERTTK